MGNQTEKPNYYEDIRLSILKDKKEKLNQLAKNEGQDLTNFLRPYLNRIADGVIKL